MALADVELGSWSPLPTGIAEVDRVLGGGLVPGSATLVGGEPGIGKSTLVVQALSALAARGWRCLLASAEESKQQVRLRAERLGAVTPGLWLLSETSLAGIRAALEEVEPQVVVVDSIQTVFDPDLGSPPGSVAQVRQCAHQLVMLGKQRGVATVLVGHVTKDGSLAGPRVLEHVVDTVLTFEGDRHHGLRLLRAHKHRFGPVGELGLFEMGERGLVAVPDPSLVLLGDRHEALAGSMVAPTVEGRRPLLVEVQALVAPTRAPMARRSAQGLDQGRLALVLAVLDRRAGVRLGQHDVYVSAVGGVRVDEPAADLALALSIASAWSDVALPKSLLGCGEVGLGGEVRHVGHLPRRLGEAARLGFTQAVVPSSAPAGPEGVELIRVPTVAHAVAKLGLTRRG